jgi:hypothetical protein
MQSVVLQQASARECCQQNQQRAEVVVCYVVLCVSLFFVRGFVVWWCPLRQLCTN